MLELVRTHTAVVRCFAPPEILDSLPEVPGRAAYRVARDELMLVGSGNEVGFPDVLVLDESGGWTVLTLIGSEAQEAFTRLTAVPPYPNFVQGSIGGTPAKAIIRDRAIHLLVPASYGDHLEVRIRTACDDLMRSMEIDG